MIAVVEAPFAPEETSTMAINYKSNFVKGLNPGVISKVGWVWSSGWT